MRLPLRSRKSAHPRLVELQTTPAGNAVVLAGVGCARQSALEHAARLPRDPDRTVVVFDIPNQANPWTWAAVVRALRGTGPLRLAVAGSGSGAAAPARWLAEQLGTEVVAPDGRLRIVAGGATFVDDGRGAGAWVSFRRGAEPERLGARFPCPPWERYLPSGDVKPGLVLDAIPAGVWLHRSRPGEPPHAGGVAGLAPRAGGMTVVLGAPDEEPIPAADVAAALRLIPDDGRWWVRLAPYGPGQDAHALSRELADQLGEQVESYTGLPLTDVGGDLDVVAVDADGHVGWRPFVRQLAHPPGAPAPVVVDYRAPAPGLTETRPGVYLLADGIVAEVIASGLWVYQLPEPEEGPEVRGAAFDPGAVKVVIGVPGEPKSTALASAAAELVERLELDVRGLVRFVFTEQPPGSDDDEATQVVASELVEEIRSRLATASTAPEPRPAETLPVPHDEPDSATAAETQGVEAGRWADAKVDPDHRSNEEERAALRRMLGPNYDTFASAVLRLLTRQPGLRAVEGEALEAVLTDLIAVRVYLSAAENKLDPALRSGAPGELYPFACCVVSGLRRLPSHRGAVLHAGTAATELTTGTVITSPGLLNAVGAQSAGFPGEVEYLIWSVTGRRIADVGEPVENAAERVLFPPGTRFKVLATERPPGGGTRHLLREVPGSANGDETVLERLRRISAARDAVAEDDRLPRLDTEWILDGLSSAAGAGD